MKHSSLLILLYTLGASAATGLIEIDDEHSEIRFAASILSVDEGNGVRLAVCTSPTKQWEKACVDSPLQSPVLLRVEWERNLNQILKINLRSEKQYREQGDVIIWTRERVRQSLEKDQFDLPKKEIAENLLNTMMDAASIEYAKQKQNEAKDALLNWLSWMPEGLVEPNKVELTVLEATDSIAYKAGLSPFGNWIHQNVCRCELVAVREQIDPVCMLRKGDAVLNANHGSLGGCNSRFSCLDQDWEKDFGKTLEDNCEGYFTAGAVVPTLSSLGSEGNKQGKNPHDRKEK